MSADTLYTFTVRGPVALMGAWRMADATEYLWGDFRPVPMTLPEIEALIGAFDECSPITWDGLTGEYESPTDPNGDLTGIYRITLEEVSDHAENSRD